jgi:hypothetical protein
MSIASSIVGRAAGPGVRRGPVGGASSADGNANAPVSTSKS